MVEKMQGIVEPALDELLQHVDNKYQLVIFASRRARQINDYYTDLQDGAIYENVGPLVDSSLDDKPLSIALHEINANKLEMIPADQAPQLGEEIDLDIDLDAEAVELDDVELEEETPDADAESEAK